MQYLRNFFLLQIVFQQVPLANISSIIKCERFGSVYTLPVNISKTIYPF